jgi:hypothetical protein
LSGELRSLVDEVPYRVLVDMVAKPERRRNINCPEFMALIVRRGFRNRFNGAVSTFIRFSSSARSGPKSANQRWRGQHNQQHED